MKGSVKRRCDVCGTRQFQEVAAKKHGCVNGHVERYSWSFTVDVARPGEKRKQVARSGFTTKAEAEKELAGLVTDHDRGSQVEPSRMSFEDHAGAWLAQLRVEGRAVSTLNSYRRNLELHVFPRIGSIRLQAVTVKDLNTLYADLLSSGRKEQAGKVNKTSGLSARTTRYIHTIISAILKDAVKKGLLARNIAEHASPPSAKSAKAPESDFWTENQMAGFLDTARDHDLFPLWWLGSFTDLRRGELCGLRWKDIHVNGCTEEAEPHLHVKQQYAPDGDGGFHFTGPKSESGVRVVTLDPDTLDVLEDWEDRQYDTLKQINNGDELAAKRNMPELVFVRLDDLPNAKPLRPDSGVSAAFDRIARKLDVPQISIHGLRHSHTSHCVAAGMDILAVKNRMGHSSVAFTLDRYGHLMPGQQSDAANRVAAKVAALIDRAG